jgi:hypothetical protein
MTARTERIAAVPAIGVQWNPFVQRWGDAPAARWAWGAGTVDLLLHAGHLPSIWRSHHDDHNLEGMKECKGTGIVALPHS